MLKFRRSSVSQSRLRPRLLALVCLVLAGLATSMAQNPHVTAAEPAGQWTAFQNGGQLVIGQPLPTQWSPGSSLAWQVDLDGYGQSTPVVFDDLIYVTTTVGDNKESYLLTAYRLADGAKEWQRQYANPTPEQNDAYISRAAPTPVVDDHTVVALFEGGILAATTKDGQPLWKRDLAAEFGPIKARHGLASSLVPFGDQAIVWVERMEEPFIISVNRQTGATAWKVAGLGATTWSSPRLITVDGQQQLVCSASGIVAGFDPASGERLWELTDVAGNTSSTPMAVGDGQFFLSASQGRGEPAADAAPNSNGVVKVVRDAEGFSASFVWRAEKATSSFGSPIVVGDMVYEVNRSGVLYGLDTNTGAQKVQKRSGVESIWATPLAADGKLYLFGRRGETSIIDIESHEVIATNQLWDVEANPAGANQGPGAAMGGHTLYAAAVAGDVLLLRRGDKLFAVTGSSQTSK